MASTMREYRLMVLGDSAVGKTSLVIRFVLDHFIETHIPSVDDSYRKQVIVDRQACIVEVNDTAGLEEALAENHVQLISVCEGLLLVYSITSRPSFERVERLCQQIRRTTERHSSAVSASSTLSLHIVIVGNKSDCQSQREVSTEEGQELARGLGYSFFETSAKLSTEANLPFHDIVRRIRRSRQVSQQNVLGKSTNFGEESARMMRERPSRFSSMYGGRAIRQALRKMKPKPKGAKHGPDVSHRRSQGDLDTIPGPESVSSGVMPKTERITESDANSTTSLNSTQTLASSEISTIMPADVNATVSRHSDLSTQACPSTTASTGEEGIEMLSPEPLTLDETGNMSASTTDNRSITRPDSSYALVSEPKTLIAPDEVPQKTTENASATDSETVFIPPPRIFKAEISWKRWLQTSHIATFLRKAMRVRLQDGHRRIEWYCDCGVQLYADFPSKDANQIDPALYFLQSSGGSQVFELQTTNGASTSSSNDEISDPARPVQPSVSTDNSQTLSTEATQDTQIPRADSRKAKFLALCVNTTGAYKTVAEVDLTSVSSDVAGFSQMKQQYLTLEFVQFTLWNLRHGYVSICNRPDSIPPENTTDYDYNPRPLRPRPPMPPEVFIHYLEHEPGELNPARFDWIPRLPKKLNRRIIDGSEAADGYGIHIIEGPNREFIFWIIIATLLGGVVAGVLWSALRNDIQGGMALGGLIVALPPAVLAALLFRTGSV